MKRIFVLLLLICLTISFISCSSSKSERVRQSVEVSDSIIFESQNVAVSFIQSTFDNVVDFKIISEKILLNIEDDLPYGMVYSFSYNDNKEGFLIVKFNNSKPIVVIGSLESSPYNYAPDDSYLYYTEPYGMYYQLENSFTFNSLHEKAKSFTKE